MQPVRSPSPGIVARRQTAQVSNCSPNYLDSPIVLCNIGLFQISPRTTAIITLMKPFLSLLMLVSSLTFSQAQNFLATLDAANEVPTGGGRTASGLVTLTLTGTTLTL